MSIFVNESVMNNRNIFFRFWDALKSPALDFGVHPQNTDQSDLPDLPEDPFVREMTAVDLIQNITALQDELGDDVFFYLPRDTTAVTLQSFVAIYYLGRGEPFGPKEWERDKFRIVQGQECELTSALDEVADILMVLQRQFGIMEPGALLNGYIHWRVTGDLPRNDDIE